MSIFSKLVSLAFLAPALVGSSWENSMTKAKSKARRKSPTSKARAASRPAQAGSKQARTKQASSRQASRKQTQARKSLAAEKAAAKRALIKVGRTAMALAKQGTQRATDAGRDVVARVARSAAGGLQSAARGIGDSGASALQSVADKVMPVGQK